MATTIVLVHGRSQQHKNAAHVETSFESALRGPRRRRERRRPVAQGRDERAKHASSRRYAFNRETSRAAGSKASNRRSFRYHDASGEAVRGAGVVWRGGTTRCNDEQHHERLKPLHPAWRTPALRQG